MCWTIIKGFGVISRRDGSDDSREPTADTQVDPKLAWYSQWTKQKNNFTRRKGDSVIVFKENARLNERTNLSLWPFFNFSQGS